MTTHLDQVLDCFVRMDVDGLEILLQEPTYYDVPKEIFLERLKTFFNHFIDPDDPENSRLDYFPGACCSRACDIFPNRLGFKFQGFPGDHFDLRFILDKNDEGVEVVKDIFPCYHLVTNELIEEEDLGTKGHFWVYEDDKITFSKDADYEVKLQNALEGFGQWEKRPANEEITVAEIKAWLTTYEPTFLSIGSYIPSDSVFWKWSNFQALYEYFELLVKFLEEFRVDLARFSVVDSSEIPHKELIDWLLQIEQRIEDGFYWMLHDGWVFTRMEQEFYEGKLNLPLPDDYKLEEAVRQPVEEFLKWFAEERKKWVDYYFALTPAELDEFMEQNTLEDEAFRVNHLLNYHWEIREKFRKQGIFIPFNLRKPPFSFFS